MQLHTTTTRTYDPTTLTCLVCTGERYGYDILDNFEGRGITILIGDQHLPAVVTITTDNCLVVIRYSNTNLTELNEYHMLPCLSSSQRREVASLTFSRLLSRSSCQRNLLAHRWPCRLY